MRVTLTFTVERAAPTPAPVASQPQATTAQPPRVEPTLPNPIPDFKLGRYL